MLKTIAYLAENAEQLMLDLEKRTPTTQVNLSLLPQATWQVQQAYESWINHKQVNKF